MNIVIEDSHQHRMKVKELINNWLQNTMNEGNFDKYDIVSNSPRLDDFSYTKWLYSFDKPTNGDLVESSSQNKKESIPAPQPNRRVVNCPINNLASIG